ncbi:MAG: hypothetical protein EOO42_04150 [Flavobacteriales bacterium]|nr:MAG: hypothetical protein EOO42_04150 [Flavobacteriales bacterium]
MKNIKINSLIALFAGIMLFSQQIKAQQMDSENQTLSAKEKSIVIISSLTAQGKLAELKAGLKTGLEAGLTINEIKEVLVHTYAYCGFPRSLNAINTFKMLLDERKAKGINDHVGREASALLPSNDKYDQGRKTLETLTKTPQPKPAKGYGEFVPRIDAFLKEHLFAAIFENDLLNYRQRELITISVLASMPGVEAQLKSHIGVGRNTGITENQLVELADLIDQYVNKTQANVLRTLLGKQVVPLVAPDKMVRIAELEIWPQHLESYKAILKEEAEISVKIEAGVIAILPMYQKENLTQVRILEIYASKDAYDAHLKTPHFQKYKTTTTQMVKSLKLVDMDVADTASMLSMFEKIK